MGITVFLIMKINWFITELGQCWRISHYYIIIITIQLLLLLLPSVVIEIVFFGISLVINIKQLNASKVSKCGCLWQIFQKQRLPSIIITLMGNILSSPPDQSFTNHEHHLLQMTAVYLQVWLPCGEADQNVSYVGDQ